MTAQKRVRVLYDARSITAQKTGVGYFTERLLVSLSNNTDVDIVAVFNHNSPVPPGLKNVRIVRVGSIRTLLLRITRKLGFQLPIEMIIGPLNYDISIYPNFVSQPSIRTRPSMLVIHDLCFMDHPDYVEKKNLSYLKRFVPGSIRRSSSTITISEFTKSRILHHFTISKPESIVVIPVPYEGGP